MKVSDSPTRCLAIAAAVLIAPLLVSCASKETPPPPPPLEPPKIELPLQIGLQVHLIGIREELPAITLPAAPADGVTPTPAEGVTRGFRLESTRLVPTEKPGGLTGLELSRDEFTAWLNALATSQTTAVYLSPLFTVWPGRSAAVNNMQQIQYVANWRSEQRKLVPEYRTLQRGFRLVASPTALAGWKDMMLRMQMDFQAGDAPARTVCESVRPAEQALTVDLPSTAKHTISTCVPVRNGYSLVVAHMFRTFAGPPASVEHMLCVVTLNRIGKEPPVDRNMVPIVPARRYSVNLLWEEPPAEPPPTSEPSTLDATPYLPEARATFLSVLAASGQSAALEWSESTSRVAGLLDDASGMRRFSVAESWAGASLDLTPTATDDGRFLTARLRARLAARPQLAGTTRMLPALRRPGNVELLEKYRFNLGRQVSARIDSPMLLTSGVEQTVKTEWVPFSDDPGLLPLPAVAPRTVVIEAAEVPLLLTPTEPDAKPEGAQ